MYSWYQNVKQKKLGMEIYVYYTIYVNMEGGNIYIRVCICMHIYIGFYMNRIALKRENKILQCLPVGKYIEVRATLFTIYHFILFEA